MKLKKILSLCLCLVVVFGTLAGCGKKVEEEPPAINPNFVMARLMGKTMPELTETLGEPKSPRVVGGYPGIEYNDYAMFVGLNLPFDTADNIPSSYYCTVIYYGWGSPEIAYGAKTGMKYGEVKAIKEFSDIPEMGEPKTDNKGYDMFTTDVVKEFDFEGTRIEVTLTFDVETTSLEGGIIRLIEEDETTTAEDITVEPAQTEESTVA